MDAEATRAELKACPFCGSAPIVQMIRARNWMASCGRACDVNKYAKTKALCIAAWNARTHPAEPDLRAVLEEARRTVEQCAKTFRRYGEIHRAKGTGEGNLKASNNDDLAEFCEQSLTRIDTALNASASQENG